MVVSSMVPITLNPHITSFTMHNSPIQSLHEGIVYRVAAINPEFFLLPLK